MPRGKLRQHAYRARALLLLAVAVVASDRAQAAGADRGQAACAGRCALCGRPGQARPITLDEAIAAARALSDGNLAQIARIDALLVSGRLGASESAEARARAGQLARLTLANWYSCLLPFANDTQGPRVAMAADIVPVLTAFTEVAVIPPPRLREVRMGGGRVCVQYDLAEDVPETNVVFGGRPFATTSETRRSTARIGAC